MFCRRQTKTRYQCYFCHYFILNNGIATEISWLSCSLYLSANRRLYILSLTYHTRTHSSHAFKHTRTHPLSLSYIHFFCQQSHTHTLSFSQLPFIPKHMRSHSCSHIRTHSLFFIHVHSSILSLASYTLSTCIPIPCTSFTHQTHSLSLSLDRFHTEYHMRAPIHSMCLNTKRTAFACFLSPDRSRQTTTPCTFTYRFFSWCKAENKKNRDRIRKENDLTVLYTMLFLCQHTR